LDIGYIAIDSIYTPVRNVNFRTEHVRVGQMTNFDKLLLDISTDGTLTPEEAFQSAAKILVEQFGCLTADMNGSDDASDAEAPAEEATEAEGESATEETKE
jgi:DNA-directed RNA polymerase subunit alpha